MKRILALVLSLFVVRAEAYVPWLERTGAEPSATPVHGPIRPRTVVRKPLPPVEVSVALDGEPMIIGWPRRNGSLKAIFWGKEWRDRHFAGDKISGMDSWYEGYSNSNYSHILDEYAPTTVADDSADGGYGGHIIDGRSELRPVSESIDTIAVEAEICRIAAHNRIDLARGIYFAVYTSKKPPPHGSCAIHGASYCGGDMQHPFGFSLIYNLDSVSSCDPRDRVTGHSQGLAAIANTSARALSDVISNWDFRGFYDQHGNEIDDLCAWTFNVPYVTFTNGSIWKLQGLWSNNAYQAEAGYPNWFGQKGCVNGR